MSLYALLREEKHHLAEMQEYIDGNQKLRIYKEACLEAEKNLYQIFIKALEKDVLQEQRTLCT